MSKLLVLQALSEKLSARFAGSIDVTRDMISVGGREVRLAGSAEGAEKVSAVLDLEIAETGEVACRLYGDGITLRIDRLSRCRTACWSSGVYAVPSASDTDCQLFAGEFENEPDMGETPWLLAALAVFDWGQPRELMLSTWLRQLGPMIMQSSSNPPPFSLLASGGFFSYRVDAFGATPSSFMPIARIPFERRPGVPELAEAIYRNALSYGDIPETLYLQLFRVVEVMFAATLRDRVADASIEQVIRTIEELSGQKELERVREVVKRSNYQFTFSGDDFQSLFGLQNIARASQSNQRRAEYGNLLKWSKAKTSIPNELVPALLYYVRNALAHAKITENDLVLPPVLEKSRRDPLVTLCRDLRLLIEEIIFC